MQYITYTYKYIKKTLIIFDDMSSCHAFYTPTVYNYFSCT